MDKVNLTLEEIRSFDGEIEKIKVEIPDEIIGSLREVKNKFLNFKLDVRYFDIPIEYLYRGRKLYIQSNINQNFSIEVIIKLNEKNRDILWRLTEKDVIFKIEREILWFYFDDNSHINFKIIHNNLEDLYLEITKKDGFILLEDNLVVNKNHIVGINLHRDESGFYWNFILDTSIRVVDEGGKEYYNKSESPHFPTKEQALDWLNKNL